MKRRDAGLELKVGFFGALGLALFLIAIWMLSNTSDLFSKKLTYYLSAANAEGLIPGATVWIAGVRSGLVREVRLNPREKRVAIRLEVAERDAESIREDSLARITTHGVLGDKVVTISAGDPSRPQLKPFGVIPSETPSTLASLVGKRGDHLVETADQIATQLNELLNVLTQNRRAGQLVDSLTSASRNISKSADLLNQQLSGMKLKDAVDSLNSVLGKMDHGNGTLSGLINDTELYDDAKALFGETNQNRIVRNLVRKTVEANRDQQAGSAR